MIELDNINKLWINDINNKINMRISIIVAAAALLVGYATASVKIDSL